MLGVVALKTASSDLAASPVPDAAAVAALERQAQAVCAGVADVQARSTAIVEAFRFISRAKVALAAMTAEIKALCEKVQAARATLAALQGRMSELERRRREAALDADELKSVSQRIAELEQWLKDHPVIQIDPLFGERPDVLIECVKGEGIVYPGARHVSKDASEDKLAWLFEQIDRGDFVGLVARPSSFDSDGSESFETLLGLVRKHRKDLAGKGKTLHLAYIPIEEDAPLDLYLPIGEANE
jgi:hypothetical protein